MRTKIVDGLTHYLTPKRPSPAALEAAVKDWNEDYPVGTPVTRYKLINPLREPQQTKTRSQAWVMGGHSAMVMVDGVTGGVALESVVPVLGSDTKDPSLTIYELGLNAGRLLALGDKEGLAENVKRARALGVQVADDAFDNLLKKDPS